MILIWDNGARYSAHKIYFIDIGSTDPDKVSALLAKHPGKEPGRDHPHVVALCDTITWRKPEACTTLATFAEEEFWFHPTHTYKCPFRAEHSCDPEMCTCWLQELRKLTPPGTTASAP